MKLMSIYIIFITKPNFYNQNDQCIIVCFIDINSCIANNNMLKNVSLLNDFKCTSFKRQITTWNAEKIVRNFGI